MTPCLIIGSVLAVTLLLCGCTPAQNDPSANNASTTATANDPEVEASANEAEGEATTSSTENAAGEDSSVIDEPAGNAEAETPADNPEPEAAASDPATEEPVAGTESEAPVASTPEPEAAASDPEDIYANFVWTASADCTACHTREIDTEGATEGGFHHSTLQFPCASCHNDTAALEEAHVGIDSSTKLPKRLKATEVAAETCLTCHVSLEAIAEKTAESTALTDENGTVVNPHALPQSISHDTLSCDSCHKMHKDNPVADVAKVSCLTCHHANVYECGTCHAH